MLQSNVIIGVSQLPDAETFADEYTEIAMEQFANYALALTGILIFVFFVDAFRR